MSAEGKNRIAVIGCGVSGLSSGIRLLEDGRQVTIFAKELPPGTTSDTAGAIWYPFKVWPRDKVLKWSGRTLETFYRLMEKEPESGIYPVQFTELLPEPSPDPWWRNAVRDFRHARPEELTPRHGDGYVFEVPFIDTPIYMPWLIRRFRQLGGVIRQQTVGSPEELGEADCIVNCSGVQARELFSDNEVYPIRGLVVSASVSGSLRYLLDQSGALNLFYIFPRKGDVVIGGTAESDNGNPEASLEEAGPILEKCRKLLPELKIDQVLSVRAGLRPGRSEVRLGIEERPDAPPVIHNYGHGGAGFTLSWGCAEDVAALARTVLAR